MVRYARRRHLENLEKNRETKDSEATGLDTQDIEGQGPRMLGHHSEVLQQNMGRSAPPFHTRAGSIEEPNCEIFSLSSDESDMVGSPLGRGEVIYNPYHASQPVPVSRLIHSEPTSRHSSTILTSQQNSQRQATWPTTSGSGRSQSEKRLQARLIQVKLETEEAALRIVRAKAVEAEAKAATYLNHRHNPHRPPWEEQSDYASVRNVSARTDWNVQHLICNLDLSAAVEFASLADP